MNKSPPYCCLCFYTCSQLIPVLHMSCTTPCSHLILFSLSCTFFASNSPFTLFSQTTSGCPLWHSEYERHCLDCEFLLLFIYSSVELHILHYGNAFPLISHLTSVPPTMSIFHSWMLQSMGFNNFLANHQFFSISQCICNPPLLLFLYCLYYQYITGNIPTSEVIAWQGKKINWQHLTTFTLW